MHTNRGFSTELIHTGEGEPAQAAPLTLPIYQTTTYLFDSAAEVEAYNEGKSDKYLYTRYGNPTVVAVEAKLAALERAEAALLFASGMAASSTILVGLLKAGDEVLCPSGIYGGTLHLLAEVLPRFGVSARFLDFEELRDPSRTIGPRTRLFWFESPINPTLRCVDIAATAAACRDRGVISVIDNTFASPINQSPLALGVDLVMHSATKYLNGHSDITAGAVMGPASLVDTIERTRRSLGTILDPMAAYAVGRGLKTLPLRMARHNETAAAIATHFASDARIAQVCYPGLSCHPDHEIARRQMRGFGGMVCLDLGRGFARAQRFFDALTLIKRAASLGGVESLCSLPVLTSQWGQTDDQLARGGVTRSMARLSIGLEDAADLIADLDQALAASDR